MPESEGITALDKAITDLWHAPQDAATQHNLGYAWSLLGKFDLALASYNKALELDPGLAYIYNDRGVLYHDQGLYAEAIENYDKAIELDPL
jgi:tetratricopeptide (TPR) repeat protein